MNKLIFTLALIAFSGFVSAAIDPNVMQAAGQGDARVLNHLRVIYANVRGVPENDNAAVKWYRLAAAQENADAQYNLGLMYEIGAGVSEDNREAVKWYQMDADQGHIAA